jgi:spermidine synthase
LTFEVYAAFLASLGLQDFSNKKLNILVCGTGAGVFTMFLKAQMGKWIESLTSVDNNEQFVQLGKQYFGFHEDAELKSVIADAYQFVRESKSETYDLVFMDVCYEVKSEEGISPPRHFLEPDFILNLTRIMKKESVCAINTMIKGEEKKKAIFK